MKKSQQYFNDFKKSHELKDWLAYFSALTWEKYTKYQHYPTIINIGEVCINQLLVETMLDTILEYPLPIRFFHSTDEAANGNDFEILLPFNKSQFILFPCQAKRIFLQKDRYESISHMIKHRESKKEYEQITYLLNYAERVKGFPIYFFYNYTPDNFHPKKCRSYSKLSKELFGCTMISAKYVFKKYFSKNKRLNKFSFNDIHPPAQPLVKLADLYKKDFVSNDKINTVFGETEVQDNELEGYDLNTLVSMKVVKSKKWVEIHSKDKKRRIEVEAKFLDDIYNVHEKDYRFNPKYRIMFTTEVIDPKKRHNSFENIN